LILLLSVALDSFCFVISLLAGVFFVAIDESPYARWKIHEWTAKSYFSFVSINLCAFPAQSAHLPSLFAASRRIASVLKLYVVVSYIVSSQKLNFSLKIHCTPHPQGYVPSEPFQLPQNSLVIKNATIWSNDGVISFSRDIRVQNGLISEIGAGIATRSGDTIIDAMGALYAARSVFLCLMSILRVTILASHLD
jgi:hypothetical protein